jgi:hypothetical protein
MIASRGVAALPAAAVSLDGGVVMSRSCSRTRALACAFGALGGLVHVGAAHAASRVTPPFSVPFDGTMLCTGVNLSTSPRMITIEVRDFAGNLVPFTNANCSATNPKVTTVDPGAVTPIACGGNGYRYCVFTIKGAGRSALRGMMRVSDGDNAPIAVLPAD